MFLDYYEYVVCRRVESQSRIPVAAFPNLYLAQQYCESMVNPGWREQGITQKGEVKQWTYQTASEEGERVDMHDFRIYQVEHYKA